VKPIHQAWCIQIEITNSCPKRCAHCTRGVRHVRRPYFMSLAEIETALRSLNGWPKVVGCMGGEPTLHPDFEQVCALFSDYFPRHQNGLWTSGGRLFDKHRQLIQRTFRVVLYNDHSETGKHHPWMIACDECIPDNNLRNELIDNCWIQQFWSPSINPNGAFFCEIAAVFDLLFDLGGGYPVAPGWWKKEVDEFQDQKNRYCALCSMCVPLPNIPNDCAVEYVSQQNAERLRKIKSPWADKLKIIIDTYDKHDILDNLGEKPWEYLGRQGIRDKRGKVTTGYAKERHHSPLYEPEAGRAAHGAG